MNNAVTQMMIESDSDQVANLSTANEIVFVLAVCGAFFLWLFVRHCWMNR
jgi:hypothetical protein